MQSVHSSTSISVSYKRYGSGPPLVLVHGGFSDHRTNWELVKPLLEKEFTRGRRVTPLERRGPGRRRFGQERAAGTLRPENREYTDRARRGANRVTLRRMRAIA